MVLCHEELRNVGTGTHTQIRAVHPLVERNQVQKGSESRSGGDTNVNLLMSVELTLPGVQAFRISVEGKTQRRVCASLLRGRKERGQQPHGGTHVVWSVPSSPAPDTTSAPCHAVRGTHKGLPGGRSCLCPLSGHCPETSVPPTLTGKASGTNSDSAGPAGAPDSHV